MQGAHVEMTILPSAASLLARQVRLLISPPTATLFESRAILSEVQSKFGPISTFISQRNDPTLHRILRSQSRLAEPSSQTSSQTILAIFDAPTSRNSALEVKNLTISCGGDLQPSPKELDPYHARGFHGRHHPPRRDFTCQIIEEEDPNLYQRLTEKHPYSHAFQIDTLQLSYGDLLKSGARLKEMADVMQTERVATDGSRKVKNVWPKQEPHPLSSKEVYCNGDLQRDKSGRAGLMAAWRQGLEKETSKAGPDP